MAAAAACVEPPTAPYSCRPGSCTPTVPGVGGERRACSSAAGGARGGRPTGPSAPLCRPRSRRGLSKKPLQAGTAREPGPPARTQSRHCCPQNPEPCPPTALPHHHPPSYGHVWVLCENSGAGCPLPPMDLWVVDALGPLYTELPSICSHTPLRGPVFPVSGENLGAGPLDPRGRDHLQNTARRPSGAHQCGRAGEHGTSRPLCSMANTLSVTTLCVSLRTNDGDHCYYCFFGDMSHSFLFLIQVWLTHNFLLVCPHGTPVTRLPPVLCWSTLRGLPRPSRADASVLGY